MTALSLRVRRPDAAAFARVCADIATRLAAVCAAMPRAEFEALVRDMARVQLRWEDRRWRSAFPVPLPHGVLAARSTSRSGSVGPASRSPLATR